MKIPVFHDDQHGTAIISGAALVNALELTGKTPRPDQRGVQRCGSLGHCLRRALCLPGREARKHHHGRHQGRDLQRPQGGHESLQGALRARKPQCARWPTPSRARTVLLGLSKQRRVHAGDDRLAGAAARLFSPWPIPIPKSPMTKPARSRTTSSWRPAAPTIPTRSTTSWDSRSSSAARSTCAPPPSTKR